MGEDRGAWPVDVCGRPYIDRVAVRLESIATDAKGAVECVNLAKDVAGNASIAELFGESLTYSSVSLVMRNRAEAIRKDLEDLEQMLDEADEAAAQ